VRIIFKINQVLEQTKLHPKQKKIKKNEKTTEDVKIKKKEKKK
jgi:hypothetical protein